MQHDAVGVNEIPAYFAGGETPLPDHPPFCEMSGDLLPEFDRNLYVILDGLRFMTGEESVGGGMDRAQGEQLARARRQRTALQLNDIPVERGAKRDFPGDFR